MRVREGASLASLTTLRLGGPARTLIETETDEEIIDVARRADETGEPLLVLGGGSNVVIADEGFGGTVLAVRTRGRTVTRGAHGLTIEIAAGESWDEFVAWSVQEKLSGVECLSGIPGLVGGAPMQNIGAYGQDVSGTLVSVTVYDRDQRCVQTMDASACRFAYRSSVFKRNPRWIVLRVTFRLAQSSESEPLRYAELCRALGTHEGARASLAQVRETVLALRRTKGMVLDSNDPESVSAGSFFVNPIVDAQGFEALKRRCEGREVPHFLETDGRVKVSAAWLVQESGFPKGTRAGSVGVSRKHALALVHRGGGSAHELMTLARAIMHAVRERFGLDLEPEPVLVGVNSDGNVCASPCDRSG